MTTWPGWAARRARSSAVLMATLFALVAVTTGILAFALGNSGALATSAARAAIASADPSEAGVRAQTRVGPDVGAQDALARAALTEGFAPAPIDIWTTLVTEPRAATGSDGPLAQRLILWSGSHLTTDLLQVDGVWPASAGEAALHAEAAGTLGVEVGDVLTIDDQELTVTALWRPFDATAPGWFGEQLVQQGRDGVHLGPLVVDRSALVGEPYLRWGVVPDAARIAPEHLSALAEGAERAKTLVAEADVTGRGITTEGDLGPTAVRAAHELAVAEAFGIVPVSLLLLVAVVGLLQVAGLLASTRERELHLLFARGASPGQVAGAGVVEALIIAVLGSALGTAAAAMALRLTSGVWSQTADVLRGGAISFGIALICLVGVTANATLRAHRGGQARSDRVKAVAGAAALVLVSAAAALATWQLRRSGSFVRDVDGAPSADLLPALSPALLLAAAAVIGLVVLAPATRLLEGVTRRLRSTTAWLAGAQLARGLVVQAVPVVLTILATGTATFAALYAGTGTALTRDVTALGQGAPLRATLGPAPTGREPLEFPTLDGVPGVTSDIPVWIDQNAAVGDLTLMALAAPMGSLADIASLPGDGSLPVESILPPVRESHAPVDLPDGTTLTVSLSGELWLDEWELLTLDLIPQYHRASADAMPPDTPAEAREAQYLWALENELDAVTSGPVVVDTTLELRDAGSGLSAEVPGPSVSIPAPVLTWDEGFTNLAFTPSRADGSVEVVLPAGRDLVLEGVRFDSSAQGASGFSSVIRGLRVNFDVSADGKPLLGAATADWTSDKALPYATTAPYREAEAAVTPTARLVADVEETDTGPIEFQRIETNRPHSRVDTVDTTGGTWSLDVTTQATSDGLAVGPLVQTDPMVVPHDVQLPPAARRMDVPVAITPALAEATTLTVGERFEATLFGRPVPVEIVAIADTIPGLTTPLGLLVDSGAWAASRGGTGEADVRPTELWAGIDGDPAAARDAALAVPGISAATVPAPADDRAAPAAQAFWIAAASALVLAITGLAAATATQVAHRRPEVAVLRAMGMTPTAQGRSRAWEIGGVLGLATLAGIGAGWLVGWLIVDPVTRSARADDIAFPTRLTLEVGPWLLLLVLGAVAVGAILFLLSRAVRRQGLDNEYREEVR